MKRETKVILVMIVTLITGVYLNILDQREGNREFATTLCAFSGGVASVAYSNKLFGRIADNNFIVGCVNGEQHYIEG